MDKPEREVGRDDLLLVEPFRDRADAALLTLESGTWMGRKPSSFLSERDITQWATCDQSLRVKELANAQQNTLIAVAGEGDIV